MPSGGSREAARGCSHSLACGPLAHLQSHQPRAEFLPGCPLRLSASVLTSSQTLPMTLCLPLPHVKAFVGIRTTLDPPGLMKDDFSTLKPADQQSHFPFASKLTLLMGSRDWGVDIIGEGWRRLLFCLPHALTTNHTPLGAGFSILIFCRMPWGCPRFLSIMAAHEAMLRR